MKRIITLTLASIMAAGLLASCGKFTCDICMEEKSGKKYETEMFGMTIVVCEDCYDLGEEIAEEIGDMELSDLGL